MANTRKKNRKKDKIIYASISILTAMLLIFIAGLGFFYLQITSSAIYDGVSIAGVDVGGLTKFEALDLLQNAGLENDQSFDVIIGDTTQTISYSDVNASIDLNTTVSNAFGYGRNGSMLERFAAILSAKFETVEFTVPYTYDAALVDTLVNKIAGIVVSDYKNSSYSISDDALIVDLGHEGRAIDAAALRAGLIDNFRNGKTENITLTPSVQEPDTLDFVAIKASVDREPVSASLNNEDLLNPFIVPEVYGITLDLGVVEKALAGTGSGQHGSVYEIPLTMIEPEITSDEVDYREPFADTLATVSTKLNAGNKPRTTNVQLACDFVNGTILMPGEEFSYNDVVGERTYERGFKDAKIYVSGEVVDGVGGGICQVSTTLYMTALRADLEISSRRNHRFTVDYAPLGEDATVVYGQVDFKFVNNTEYPLRIDCVLDNNQVIVTFMGNQVTLNKEVKLETKVLEKTPFETVTEYDPELAPDETEVKNGGYTGYKTETYRVVYLDGVEASRTLENKSTYTKLDKVILSGTDPNAPTQEPDQPIPGTTTPDIPVPGTDVPGTDVPGTDVPGTDVPGTDASGVTTTADPYAGMPDWLRPATTSATASGRLG